MVSRIAALFILALALVVAGSLVLAEQMSVAQAPSATMPAEQAAPAQPAAPAPAAPASASAVSAPPVQVPAASATPAPAPIVSAPPAPAPAPVVSAPPAQAPAAVLNLLPQAKPTPVVEAPLPRAKPSISVTESEKGVAASLLFAGKKLPSQGRATVIGYYSHGCLQGGVELPVTGPHWQVMRLSRNRNWGHPELVSFVKRFSALAAKATGWPGILIGDMAQPRGGPLPFGHTSHQVGLDVDIWYMPMPDRTLSKQERENITATRMITENGLSVNNNWTPADAAFLHAVAEQPEVERVLVNAAVKKKMCELEGNQHHAWMAKLRPWYFHKSHVHVRLKCPADSPHCRHQPPVTSGDGCAKKDLAFWFSNKTLNVKPEAPSQKLEKPMTMAALPAACKEVLNAPAKQTNLAADAK